MLAVGLAATLLTTAAAAADSKDAYSNYADKGVRAKETTLQDFESLTASRWAFGTENATAALDTSNKKQGAASLSVKSSHEGWATAFSANSAFTLDASDKKHTFLKMWIYVNDITLLGTDKSGGAYDEQGTIFINIHSGRGSHQWNHTISGSGWHELELSFCNSNNMPESLEQIDYTKLNTISLRYVAKAGLEIKVDDLRAVTYSSGYTPSPAPYNGKLISNCDYNEFSGAVIGEWYGASFDLSDKKEGASSLRLEGNAQHNEYRLYFGGLDIPLDKERDVLCFWLYISDMGVTGMSGWVIELNQVQDIHEYQCDFMTMYTASGGLNNGWNQVRIPLSQMQANLDSKFGSTVTLHSLRITAPGISPTKNYILKVDQIYLADSADLPPLTKPTSPTAPAMTHRTPQSSSRPLLNQTTKATPSETVTTERQMTESTQALESSEEASSILPEESSSLVADTPPKGGSLWTNPVLFIIIALILAGAGIAAFFLWKKFKSGTDKAP